MGKELSSVILRVFTFHFFNLFFCIMFFDVRGYKWCSRPISLLFYGLSLSCRCLFLSKSCSYAFHPHVFLHVPSQTGPPREVECKDSLTVCT